MQILEKKAVLGKLFFLCFCKVLFFLGGEVPKEEFRVVPSPDCIDRCDFRVGPGPRRSQGRV